jgi:cullin 1
MQRGIEKLIRILENFEDVHFTADEYMGLYTDIYDMCIQRPPYDYSSQLYDRYKDVLVQYLRGSVWFLSVHFSAPQVQ